VACTDNCFGCEESGLVELKEKMGEEKKTKAKTRVGRRRVLRR
jgi:hypothetical protein